MSEKENGKERGREGRKEERREGERREREREVGRRGKTIFMYMYEAVCICLHVSFSAIQNKVWKSRWRQHTRLIQHTYMYLN